MSNPSIHLTFPDELIVEVRKAIKQEFESSPFGWVKFTFQVFARYYVHKHFRDYPIASDKLELEASLEKGLIDLEHLERDFKRKVKIGDKLQKKYLREVNTIRKEIKGLEANIALSNKSPQTIAANIRKERIEDWYQFRLRDYPIKPSTIPGIGPTRVSALDFVDIRTAADIIPENARLGKEALNRVRGAAPQSEWRDLENWREKLKERMPHPIIKEATEEDIQTVLLSLTRKRDSWQKAINEKNKQIESPYHSSSDIGQQLASNENEQKQIKDQMVTLKIQVSRLASELEKYTEITSGKLLEAVLNE